MPNIEQKIRLDARSLAGHINIIVKVDNIRWFGFGVYFIRLGCWIAGLKYKDVIAESTYFEE